MKSIETVVKEFISTIHCDIGVLISNDILELKKSLHQAITNDLKDQDNTLDQLTPSVISNLVHGDDNGDISEELQTKWENLDRVLMSFYE